ncbi:MAG TPA: hypothetical protein PKO06_21990, partial [Candidatus Ozemobacteraceae bacterium]|nr:hypothetical protein [Candidatus Ozemobacteraceae bacterium]
MKNYRWGHPMKRQNLELKVLFFAILFVVGAVGFQGCKENSTNIPLNSIGSVTEIDGVSISTMGKLSGLVVQDSGTTGIPNISVRLLIASGSIPVETTLTT